MNSILKNRRLRCDNFHQFWKVTVVVLLLLETGQTTATVSSRLNNNEMIFDTQKQDTVVRRLSESFETPVHYKLDQFLTSNYNRRVLPRRQFNDSVLVSIKISVYQIIELNEPYQYILLNCWIVERWKDELLYWDPQDFEGIEQISLPKESVWIPDTTLYNSVVMSEAESRRLINVKITTNTTEKSALVELLYPTLYKSSCLLDLRFFPYDMQACKMVFGSWTHDNLAIDYEPYKDPSGRSAFATQNCLENEEWNIIGAKVTRKEVKFDCCKNSYTLLEFDLYLQRKPLFYLINLILPTGIITLIAIVGFFSSSTINDVREEKITLGITTLLSMSILIFMVSDTMPKLGSSVPLIGWYYTGNIMLISVATLAGSLVIYTQKKGIIGKRPQRKTMTWAKWLGSLIRMNMPLIMLQAYVMKAKQKRLSQRKVSVWQKWQKLSKDIVKTSASASPNHESPEGIANGVERRSSVTDAQLLGIGNNNGRPMKKIVFQTDEDESPEDELAALKSHNSLDDYEEYDDEKSYPGSLCEYSTKRRLTSLTAPQRKTTSGSLALPEIYSIEGMDLTNMTTLQQRNLAQLEWDWIAAVVERTFLIIFFSLFCMMAFGTMALGFYYLYFLSLPSDVTHS